MRRVVENRRLGRVKVGERVGLPKAKRAKEEMRWGIETDEIERTMLLFFLQLSLDRKNLQDRR
jgi:hypothetical protein